MATRSSGMAIIASLTFSVSTSFARAWKPAKAPMTAPIAAQTCRHGPGLAGGDRQAGSAETSGDDPCDERAGISTVGSFRKQIKHIFTQSKQREYDNGGFRSQKRQSAAMEVEASQMRRPTHHGGGREGAKSGAEANAECEREQVVVHGWSLRGQL